MVVVGGGGVEKNGRLRKDDRDQQNVKNDAYVEQKEGVRNGKRKEN